MSYPKKHPVLSSNGLDSRTLEKLQKKEQLKNLLVTKFKTKYGVKLDQTDHTKLIQGEVESLINTNNLNVTALNQLDKKLQEHIGSPVKGNTQSTSALPQINTLKKTESQKSLRSSLHSNRSKALQDAGKQLLKSSSQLELGHNYMTGSTYGSSPGKRVGLQEELWCDIVKYNYEQYQKQQEEAKKKREEQREQLKSDLAKQVQEKRLEKLQQLKDEEKYAETCKVLLKEEQDREKKKQQDFLDKVKVEAQIRQEQLVANKQRKQMERKNAKEHEEKLKQRMQQELKDEETRNKQKIQVFRQQCAKQIEENKILKELQIQREKQEENRGPVGTDLLKQLYEEKKHVSYEKAARNDKVVSLLQSRLAQGESQKRLNQEEQAIYNYVKNKEREDKIDEDRRLRNKKNRELEMKRILDIQMQERNEKKRLNKYEEDFEAKYIRKDVEEYTQVENEKKKQYEDQVKHFTENLVKQIEEKKIPKNEITPELIMNKPILDQIKGVRV